MNRVLDYLCLLFVATNFYFAGRDNSMSYAAVGTVCGAVVVAVMEKMRANAHD